MIWEEKARGEGAVRKREGGNRWKRRWSKRGRKEREGVTERKIGRIRDREKGREVIREEKAAGEGAVRKRENGNEERGEEAKWEEEMKNKERREKGRIAGKGDKERELRYR